MQIHGTKPSDNRASSTGMIWQATLANSPPCPIKKPLLFLRKAFGSPQVKCYFLCPQNRNRSGWRAPPARNLGADASQEGPAGWLSRKWPAAQSPPTLQARKGRPLWSKQKRTLLRSQGPKCPLSMGSSDGNRPCWHFSWQNRPGLAGRGKNPPSVLGAMVHTLQPLSWALYAY